jgi:hypothetical protein
MVGLLSQVFYFLVAYVCTEKLLIRDAQIFQKSGRHHKFLVLEG